jgi:hypothetical protein
MDLISVRIPSANRQTGIPLTCDLQVESISTYAKPGMTLSSRTLFQLLYYCMRSGHIIAICAHTPDPRFQDLLMLVGFSCRRGWGVPSWPWPLEGFNQTMADAVNDG